MSMTNPIAAHAISTTNRKEMLSQLQMRRHLNQQHGSSVQLSKMQDVLCWQTGPAQAKLQACPAPGLAVNNLGCARLAPNQCSHTLLPLFIRCSKAATDCRQLAVYQVAKQIVKVSHVWASKTPLTFLPSFGTRSATCFMACSHKNSCARQC